MERIPCSYDPTDDLRMDLAEAEAEVERLRERGDAVVHTAREVMHGRMHTGQLLEAMNAWESKG